MTAIPESKTAINVLRSDVVDTMCCLALEPIHDLQTPVQAAPCGHIFERSMIQQWANKGHPACPLDWQNITMLHPVILVDFLEEPQKPTASNLADPTALKQKIKEMRETLQKKRLELIAAQDSFMDAVWANCSEKQDEYRSIQGEEKLQALLHLERLLSINNFTELASKIAVSDTSNKYRFIGQPIDQLYCKRWGISLFGLHAVLHINKESEFRFCSLTTDSAQASDIFPQD